MLLLGLHGVRWDIIAEDGVGEFLQETAQQGAFRIMVMEPPTLSGQGGHQSLQDIDEHGVTDNSLVGKRLWNYPDFLARAFYQDQSTRTIATASWPVLADPHGLGPIIHPRMEQQFAGLHNVIVRDGETLGYERIDAEIASIATAALRQKGLMRDLCTSVKSMMLAIFSAWQATNTEMRFAGSTPT